MRCEDFQEAVLSEVESTEVLDHLRTCENCLNRAVDQNPDLMFRAIGGELEPPGGVDEFAADVMHQIHVRDAERTMSTPARRSAFQRWALAAAATFMVVTSAIFWPRGTTVETPVPVAQVSQQTLAAPLTVRPVVEHYDAPNAMIIEIPEEETSDLKVVMIFDESLPADI